MTSTFDDSEMLSQTNRRIEDRMIELELENTRLQRLVAELLIKNQQLRDGQVFGPPRNSTAADHDAIKRVS